MAKWAARPIIPKRLPSGNGNDRATRAPAATGPRSHDEIGQREQLLEILPPADLAERVHADDEEHLGLRPPRCERSQRIDREGFAGTPDFDVRNGESAVVGYRETDHFQDIFSG